MTNALCWGTTVEDFATTTTTSRAITMKTSDVNMFQSMLGWRARKRPLGIGPDQQRQALDADHASPRTGRHRPVAVVADRPESAAMLGLAALAGAERNRQREQFVGRPAADLRRVPA